MFILAIIIGIYSYVIFFLGTINMLYPIVVFWVSVVYSILSLLVLYRDSFLPDHLSFKNFKKAVVGNKIFFSLLVLVGLQAIVNLIGSLGPELAFDALWYHLTLPKLAILSHAVSYIPGGLFYYSAMPKLAEMLYIPVLMASGEIVAKVMHFSFGLLTCFVLYRLSRKFVNSILSMLAVVVFYANLVVAWESITAYIDLVRAFFELLSVYAFITFYTNQKRKWFVLSALLLGFAIATKVLAIGSLGIFLVLVTWYGWQRKATIVSILFHDFFYAAIALIVPLPWFIFAFVNTGNPVYPFFTKTYAVNVSHSLMNPMYSVQSFWNLFVHSPDPLSPLYVMFLPLLIVVLCFLPQGEEKMRRRLNILLLYSLLSLLVWYITPNTGGGRFIVSYLPVYSLILVTVFIYNLPKWFKKALFVIIIFVSVISVGYRGLANKKYIPVILGMETKQAFLKKNLNFSFGDFCDTDNFFAQNIKSTDRVLLYGFHNLYYVDMPFIDSSYIRRGDTFNYIAVQKGIIPQRFANWERIYHNNQTGVTLYALKHKEWVSY